MRTRGFLVVVAMVLLAFVGVTRAAGADDEARAVAVVGVASAVDENSALPEAHGWMVLPGAGEQGPALVHLPPRPRAIHGGKPGVARRLMRPITQPPLLLAADGRRLYLLFDGAPRKLLSIEAAPTPIDGIWTDIPPGLMTPSTPPPDLGVPVGMAAAGGKVHILFRRDGAMALARLDGDDWSPVELPPDLDAAGDWSAFGDRRGLGLVRLAGGSAAIWRHDAGTGWTHNALDVPAGTVPVGVLHGRVVLVEPDGEGKLGVVLVEASGPARLASTKAPVPAEGSGLNAVVIPDASGRLVLLWRETLPGGEPGHMIREISLSTGAVLYDGPVERVVPVSAREFRLMAIAMLLVMIVSLYVVLRPVDDRTPPVVPEGFALATPARRFVATALDVFLCATPISWATGVPVGQIVTLGVMLEPGGSWVAVPALFALGLVYGSVMEAAFRGTVGKFLLGCRVIPADGGSRRLGPGASFLRNVIKWVLPPVAGLALLDPSGRHRGDLLAGAVVVVRLEPTKEPDKPSPPEPTNTP